MKWLRKLLFHLGGPIYRWGLARLEPADPWAPSTSWIPLEALGSGAKRPFGWYLEGETSVKPTTLDELCEWLRGCQYARDQDLFHEPDFWQHPKTFEHLRKGDCEDFALWAWRKLIELGIDARFFIGEWGGEASSRHAWVVFRHEDRELLLEPQEAADRMVLAFDDVKAQYTPYFFVDRACKPIAVAGYLFYLKRRDLRAKSAKHAA
jgi:hypothetical protein